RTAAIHAGGDGWRDELKSLRLRYKSLLEKAAQLKAPAVLHEKSTVEAEIFRELARLKSGTVIVDDAEALARLKALLAGRPELDWS
ncbi:ribonuclease E/G, partial [Streptococcus parasanguinis]|uniref:ribonuclease E/G n=1 Tax=Streptococcus parasanguinis TaxID=1318 RepID=UPI001D0938A5